MKKVIAMLLVICMACISLAACGSQEASQPMTSPASPAASAAPETPTAQESTDVETEDGAENETKTAPEECAKLIGLDDTAAAEMLGGGQENVAGDGVTLIGRIYKANIFGEDVEISSAYDDNGLVDNVTFMLSDPEASVYCEQLEEIYGESSDSQDTPSESGATWQEWSKDGFVIRLWQMYGLTSIEIRAAEGQP